MGVCDEIVEIRDARCGLSSLTSPIIPELAREFGLSDQQWRYKEIGEDDGRKLVHTLLHRDLAYNAELMSAAQAEELGNRFLGQFGPGTRYFTNGTWHTLSTIRSDGAAAVTSWDPVTSATFDMGILAIGPERSGCMWVEDED